jgi:hypothetical protein
MNRDRLRLGMSGSATAFAGNAGVIGLLASILVWVGSALVWVGSARHIFSRRGAKWSEMREKKRTSLDCAARFR